MLAATSRVLNTQRSSRLTLAEHLVKTFSQSGDLVLDNFCGSGQTLLAAKGCGRRYLGIEREEKYVRIALGRLR